ncbi:Glycosyl hydrolase [Erythrobacter dokdonensis DSW-74]|uniref:Glycosyl hydrolase n=2 Tax=Erythrobacter TaxID=1041 RepID=A0A1A7BJ28_9SPHN|nr:Glycosyl hydrolase [Erythrobacter dokdonensis DSW-74]
MRAAGLPFGAVLEQELARGVKVTSYGIGGATAAGGERRWRASNLPEADLVVIAYGTNDAAPRGWLRRKKPVPIAAYKTAMTRQIRALRARGAQVILMAPPPGGSMAINHRLAPYRMAARDIARAENIPMLDPADAFASCSGSEPLLTHDALHMNPAGHQCLGRWLARQLCPTAVAP